MSASLPVLIVLFLLLPGTLLAQTAASAVPPDAVSSSGPSERRLVEAGRSAAADLAITGAAVMRSQTGTGAPGDWARVLRITRGAELVVTTATLDRAPRLFARADDREIVVLDVGALSGAPEAERAILNLLIRRPDLLALEAMTFEGIRIAPEGVFYRGTKVSERDEVFPRIARGDVIEIAGEPRLSGSGKAAGIGVAVGAAGGYLLGGLLALSGHQGLGVAALFTLPIAGGLLGNHSSRQLRQEIYYRRP